MMLKAAAIAAFVFAAACSSAGATTCGTMPYTFTNGTIADANQVNSNFAALLTCSNTLLAPLTGAALVNPTINANIAITGGAPASTITYSTFDTATVGTNNFYIPNVFQSYMRSGGTGQRITLYPTVVTGYGASQQFFVGEQPNAISCGTTSTGQFCTSSDNGGGSGNFFGSNPYVLIYPGTAASAEATGLEANTDVRTNVNRKTGIQIVDTANSTGVGTANLDASLLIGNQDGGVGYVAGIQFGAPSMTSNFGVKATGSLIRTFGFGYAHGIDFSASTFSADAVKTPGFTVSGTGAVTATLPTSAGAGGINICVDTAGVFYKKAACP